MNNIETHLLLRRATALLKLHNRETRSRMRRLRSAQMRLQVSSMRLQRCLEARGIVL